MRTRKTMPINTIRDQHTGPGRVGALAVALGIGAALAAVPAAASADAAGSESDSASAPHQRSTARSARVSQPTDRREPASTDADSGVTARSPLNNRDTKTSADLYEKAWKDGSPAPTAAVTPSPTSIQIGTARLSAQPITPPVAPDRALPQVVAPSATYAVGADATAVATATPDQSIFSAFNQAINGIFNSAFNWLSTFPSNPIANLLEGALVLVRRSLFFVPTGVSATQIGTELSISVNQGSVAYFRQDGAKLQVSGDPGFWGSPSFSSTTVSDVVVTNSGNAGSAGFVFASGKVDANLATSQVDSIRFQSSAAFTGTVKAVVTSGALTVTDAIRGLAGVSLEAPVRLANNVEIDARDGDATFTGTVDAQRAGSQSLSVLASGTTTFNSAVGGQTALSGLSTRGVTAVDIPQSADSKTIALHYLQQHAEGLSQLVTRIGIDVAIGDNPSQLYEFDTGAFGFLAGYNSAFWNGVQPGFETISATFGSGNFLNGVAANAVVTLGSGAHTVSTANPVQIGAMLSGGNTNTGQTFDFTQPNNPPFDDLFFGDFGAGLSVQNVNGQPTLASPLFQLPGNLGNGFLVQLGPLGVQPQLTVGVTDALREQFTYAIPIGPATGALFPGSTYSSFPQFAFTGEYSVTQDGVTVPLGTFDFPQCSQQCLPTVFDSGGAIMAVGLNGVNPPYPYEVNSSGNGLIVQPGTIFNATFPTAEGRPPLTWSFAAGEDGPVNMISYDGSDPAAPASGQSMNAFNIYNDFDVMFDVEKQVIWLRPTNAQSTVVLNSVTTTGNQSYAQSASLAGAYSTGGGAFTVGGAVNLLDDTTVNTDSGDITFYGTVDGGYDLTVNSIGATTFVRQVGFDTVLSSLTTDAGGSTSTAEVVTTGNQTYGDDTTLNYFYQTTTGNFSIAGATTLAGFTELQILGGNVTFGGPVNSLPGKGFVLEIGTDGGAVNFNDAVGATNPLGGLVLNNLSQDQSTVTATTSDAINLSGALGYSGTSVDVGLQVGNNVTVAFTGGGTIQGFSQGGVAFTGASSDSQLVNFAIANNGGPGITAGTGGAVTDLRIVENSIFNNQIAGVAILGAESFGNVIGANSIYANSELGITLLEGANDGQPAPQINTAQLIEDSAGEVFIQVTGTIIPVEGYTGDFALQLFGSASGSQGQFFIGQIATPGGAFTAYIPYAPWDGLIAVVTATVIPVSGPSNTSEFSAAAPIV